MNKVNHIAIIMDGNGRWGKKKNKSRNFGHLYGVKVIENIVKESIKIKIPTLTFYTFSYLNVFFTYKEMDNAKKIYEKILDNEIANGMPKDVISKGKISFGDRLNKIDWKSYYNSWPFNESALALYEWAPIADELKTLDRKIVLNSMILKWDNIKDEFGKLISI